MHDVEAVPKMLEQISEPASRRYITDGAYDTQNVYDAIEKHSTKAKIVITPRDNAVESNQWHAEQNKSLDIIEEHGKGGPVQNKKIWSTKLC